jgi:hypothetical protein
MTKIMYAIGTNIGEGREQDFAMHHGPHPSEAEMLKVEGESDNDYIIRFIGETGGFQKHDLIWRWSCFEDRWKRNNPRVLNKNKDNFEIASLEDTQCEYIGRGSKWGNPFKIGKDGTREEVIIKYAEYLMNKPELLVALPELKNKFLICYCAPQACHGDILIDLANDIDTGDDEWKFHGFEHDSEDFEVKAKELQRWWDTITNSDCNVLGGLSDADVFNAGFERGAAWMLYKLGRDMDWMTRIQADKYLNENKKDDDIPF